jgi:hypothetical protein
MNHNLFRATALVAALSLGACQTLTAFVAPTSTTAVVQDIKALQADTATVVNGLQAILPTVAALGSKYAPQIAAIEADLAKASAQLAVLNGFTNIADAQGTTQIIVTVLSDALKTAAALPIPVPYSTAITAANVLLPVLAGYFGLPLPASAVAPGQFTLTPDQARRNLQSWVHRG